MNHRNDYDLIIAGAGASGLSLLWNLLHSDSLKEHRILIADRSFDPLNDKTWCFWDDTPSVFSDLIYHTWKTLQVTVPGRNHQQELKKYSYHCIRSVDFSKKILEFARNKPNVSFLETDITGFFSHGGFATLQTDNGDFHSPWIFQSALKPPGLEHSRSDITLNQHFLGWEIETEKPAFDPKRAVLMDFDLPQKNGVTFQYLLPFSENRALSEYTLFSEGLLSNQEYKEGILLCLKKRFNLNREDYKIRRIEKGVIPMEDRHYPAWYCERVLNTGTVGGLTKPSTGYTFTRIQRQAKEIVNALEAGNTPPLLNSSAYRFRVYDMMLLWLLKNDPKKSIDIFDKLFGRNSFDIILSFLEEETNPAQEIAIFASLPSIPFFKSIWKMKHRIFTGA